MVSFGGIRELLPRLGGLLGSETGLVRLVMSVRHICIFDVYLHFVY
jgi:hypothetical protein